MLIGLHDSDATGFPNLALMKLSAYHKARGDQVDWWNPLLQYDKVYSSKVFTFTQENPYLPPETVRGGTGYGIYDDLPQDVDAMLPVVQRAIRYLEECGVKPYRVFVYLLVQDVPSAERRAIALRDMGAEVFAQPYRDYENDVLPTAEQKRFARWVNRKEIFKSTNSFAEYKKGGIKE